MRILVTGVTGQVSRALTKRLKPLGDVVPADRSVLNLAEPGTLAEALDRLSPDLIVNPAAYTAVDRAEDERELAFIVNGEAPGAIARWASRMHVPLVHFSTDYVFDGKGETPWHEDSPPAPLSVYGASKLAGEKAIRVANGPHLIVRTSWVYAATGANFLRTIARFARERTELKVVADQFMSPTATADVASHVIVRGGRRCKDGLDRDGPSCRPRHEPRRPSCKPDELDDSGAYRSGTRALTDRARNSRGRQTDPP